MRNKGIDKIKYEQQVLGKLGMILRKDFRDPLLQFLTFTKVELSGDYSQATVYWDTFNTDKKEELFKALEVLRPKMRTRLAKVLDVRNVPALVFTYDGQYESEKRLEELLKKEGHE